LSFSLAHSYYVLRNTAELDVTEKKQRAGLVHVGLITSVGR